MAKTDTQVCFRVTYELKERLEAQARKERRNLASMIRNVLEEYLEQQGESS